MTPIILDSQEAVDRHNEKVKVQREAVNKYRESRDWFPFGADDLNDLFPFAQLRPSGFVGGSGKQWQYFDEVLNGWTADGAFSAIAIARPDRAAASAALCRPEFWLQASDTVRNRWNTTYMDLEKWTAEVIAEAQAILDREGGK